MKATEFLSLYVTIVGYTTEPGALAEFSRRTKQQPWSVKEWVMGIYINQGTYLKCHDVHKIIQKVNWYSA